MRSDSSGKRMERVHGKFQVNKIYLSKKKKHILMEVMWNLLIKQVSINSKLERWEDSLECRNFRLIFVKELVQMEIQRDARLVSMVIVLLCLFNHLVMSERNMMGRILFIRLKCNNLSGLVPLSCCMISKYQSSY